MIEAVAGLINSGVVLSFDVQFGGHDCAGPECTLPDCGSMKINDPDLRAPIVKNSKSYEKGSFVKYSESEDNDENQKFYVVFKDMVNTFTVILVKDLTKERIKIYANIPTPQNFEISEFWLEGNFRIQKINLEPSKKTVEGSSFSSKLVKEGHLSIENKLFFKVVGQPLVKESKIETEYGEIRFIQSGLTDVEI